MKCRVILSSILLERIQFKKDATHNYNTQWLMHLKTDRSNMAYKLYARSEQDLIHTPRIYSNNNGMSFRLKKCS